MEKNNLLNLLIVGGIAIAIALGGAGLGIAVNKSKSTSSSTSTESVVVDQNESTDTLKSAGLLGLYGGFKTLVSAELKAAKQAILGIEVIAGGTDSNTESIPIAANSEEVKILDLSKSNTIGNLEWILKQVKYPNDYTSKVGLQELKKVDYTQKVTFHIKENLNNLFNAAKEGIFAVKIDVVYTAAVKEAGNVPAKAESWKLVYSLLEEVDTSGSSQVAGAVGTATVANANSALLINALDSDKLAEANLQVLHWKSGGVANVDGSDADLTVILNKLTGEVFVLTKAKSEITERDVSIIAAPTTTL